MLNHGSAGASPSIWTIPGRNWKRPFVVWKGQSLPAIAQILPISVGLVPFAGKLPHVA